MTIGESRCGKTCGRPFHKFGEIEQESRLDLIFRRRFLRQGSEAENQEENQNRHLEGAVFMGGFSPRTARNSFPALCVPT